MPPPQQQQQAQEPPVRRLDPTGGNPGTATAALRTIAEDEREHKQGSKRPSKWTDKGRARARKRARRGSGSDSFDSSAEGESSSATGGGSDGRTSDEKKVKFPRGSVVRGPDGKWGTVQGWYSGDEELVAVQFDNNRPEQFSVSQLQEVPTENLVHSSEEDLSFNSQSSSGSESPTPKRVHHSVGDAVFEASSQPSQDPAVPETEEPPRSAEERAMREIKKRLQEAVDDAYDTSGSESEIEPEVKILNSVNDAFGKFRGGVHVLCCVVCF
jgi:hypothetical protein